MEWPPRYSIGVKVIDDQHQELFRRVAQLDAAMRTGDREEVTKLLSFLGSYVVEHFGDEEREMLRVNYPLYRVHKVAHDRFVAQFLETKHEYEVSGATVWLSIRVHKVVLTWLKEHILGMDQQLGKYLQAHPEASSVARG